jgi:hypothetical protein
VKRSGFGVSMLLVLLPGVAFAEMARKVPATSQQGSGTHAEPTATPGPGIETGSANAMAGGRTDLGPTGETGISGNSGTSHERALAKVNDQTRGENERGSFLRPADTAAQIELNPQVMGSGADYGPFPFGGHNYFDGHAVHGKANGIASGPGNPGGASAHGIAGKSVRRDGR